MKDRYYFEYSIAFEKDTCRFTIRANTNLSDSRFIPIVGFNSYEQAEYFLKFIKEKGGMLLSRPDGCSDVEV